MFCTKVLGGFSFYFSLFPFIPPGALSRAAFFEEFSDATFWFGLATGHRRRQYCLDELVDAAFVATVRKQGALGSEKLSCAMVSAEQWLSGDFSCESHRFIVD